MAKPIKVKPKKKKMGRPATGKDPVYGLRIPKDLIALVEVWAEENGGLSRSEAIRQLVEYGLGNDD